ncbi:MAG: 50S ribosomal protein L35 [Candidatus Magasanikbacteria bacterium]
MPKMKTHKGTAKRFMVKKSKKGTKVLKRADGQNHFNSRESGNAGRNKRSDNVVSLPLRKTVLKALPYC